MTLVNLGEVTYVIERKYRKQTADRIFTQFLANDGDGGREAIQWVPIDENLVRLAASLKAGGGLAYADCFAAAAAAILGCPVLTGDREFERAERAGISVRWL
jgi:predicted nucleic acid-binding protein